MRRARLLPICRHLVPALPALLLTATLGASVALAGCKSCEKQGDGAEDGGAHAQAQSLTPQQAAQVLAKVGDETITLGDYVAALEHMDQFDRLRFQSVARRKELLDEMINVELLAMEATAKGYDKTPLAEQELRGILRDAMLAEARKGVPTPAEIPESEVRAWFEAHRADYKDPERRRLSVIALKDEATASAVLALAAKTTTAAEFGELVRTRSIDPFARDDVPVDLAGDLGIVSPPGDPRGANARVPEPVREAAFKIADVGGVFGEVVRAGGRHYVVRLTQKLPAHERALAEAERTIRVKLAQDKLRAKEEELVAALAKDVKIEIDDAALATVKAEVGDAGAARAPGGR